MKHLKLIAIIGVLVIFLAGVAGMVWFTFTHLQPDVVYVREVKPVYVDRPVYQPVITEQVVEKVVYQDRIVEKVVPPALRIFDRIDQFPKMSVLPLTPNACLAVAKEIQLSLLNQGYVTSVVFAVSGYYYGVYVTDAPGGHAGLLVETKEDGWWFVDVYPWRVTKLF